MTTIFSKNCVLSGPIDNYCLICAEHLRHEEETYAHILNSQHKNNLKSCSYFEKHKDDSIRKIKRLYFCEICSMTFPTTTKVGLHINEESHIMIKATCSRKLQRINDVFIAFGNLLITEEAWNGFVDRTCVLCNAEFDNGDTHKVSEKHILNLIERKVVLHGADTVYRKIDDSSYQCLNCNLMIGNLNNHCNTAEHRQAFVYYKSKSYNNNQDNVKIELQSETQNIANNTKDTKIDDKNNHENNNGEKLVDKGRNKGEDKTAIKQSVDSSKGKCIEDLDDAYCKTLGGKNYIAHFKESPYCILCEWALDDSPEKHIRSKHHQSLLKIHKERLENKIDAIKNNVETHYKSDLSEFVDKYQKNSVNIDLINETAVCKKCLKNIDYNTAAIDRHIGEHKKTFNKNSQDNVVTLPSGIKSNGNDRTTLYTKPVLLSAAKKKQPTRFQSIASSAAEVEDYARQNGMTPNRADKSFYCNVCNRRLPTTLQELEKHVSSGAHKEKISKQSSDEQIVIKGSDKEPICKALKKYEVVETANKLYVVLNNKYVVDVFSFFFIVKYDEVLVCHACDIELVDKNVMEHALTHRDIIRKCLFITSLENEFIREINLEVYHCGHCDIVRHNLEDILEHIETDRHKEQKGKAQSFLKQHTSNPYRGMRTKLEEEFSFYMELVGFKPY